ncbi:hypothetical protein MSAN_01904800 [Mycena sanguinolenta]|uniref:Uncharacterized protein n=1 Tax=Mycena sanguinolenta TaxID=230812 RepID=A0A8H7CR93_9AGAR|nr:hypothetical protein MSAN_01904800 [Mycena sanguinolenta]
MKPCTSDAAQWRNFTAIVQREKFRHAHYTFTSKINPAKERPGPRCVSCKNEDHYQPGCKTIRDPDFWGPTTQLKDATGGPPCPDQQRRRRRKGTWKCMRTSPRHIAWALAWPWR